MDIIRGMIVTRPDATLEIEVPSDKARQPGWTRMEAAGKVLAEIGIAVEGANRVEVRPVSEEFSLMIWHHYPGEDNRASRVFGFGRDQ